MKHHSEMILMASAAGLCVGGATWLLSEWFHKPTDTNEPVKDESDTNESTGESMFSNPFGTNEPVKDESDTKSTFPSLLGETSVQPEPEIPSYQEPESQDQYQQEPEIPSYQEPESEDQYQQEPDIPSYQEPEIPSYQEPEIPSEDQYQPEIPSEDQYQPEIPSYPESDFQRKGGRSRKRRMNKRNTRKRKQE